MAVSDFVSGRGWDIDVISKGDFLRVQDRLYIASFGNQNLILFFERDGTIFLEGRARYSPNMTGGFVAGVIMSTNFHLQFDGSGKLKIRYSSSGGGPSPNGGGSSSGPGGN